MKKYQSKVIIIMCMVSLSLACADILLAEEKYNVAVLDLASKNVSKDDADIITEFFRSELIKTGKFNVLDRNHISKILDELHFQSSGLSDLALTMNYSGMAIELDLNRNGAWIKL